jgi:hypothetical protein
MERNHKKKRILFPLVQRKPVQKATEESGDSLYHIALMILVGVMLCLVLGALDYVSEDTVPPAYTTEIIESFE